MDIRCISKGDSAELRKGNELSIARAVNRLKVLDDPFGVLFAKCCLATKGVRDGLACGFVRDVSVRCQQAFVGWEERCSYAVPLVFELATTFM